MTAKRSTQRAPNIRKTFWRNVAAGARPSRLPPRVDRVGISGERYSLLARGAEAHRGRCPRKVPGPAVLNRLHAGAGIEVESLPAAREFRIVVSIGEPSGIAKFMEKARVGFVLT
jgi:hypothetical protein